MNKKRNYSTPPNLGLSFETRSLPAPPFPLDDERPSTTTRIDGRRTFKSARGKRQGRQRSISPRGEQLQDFFVNFICLSGCARRIFL